MPPLAGRLGTCTRIRNACRTCTRTCVYTYMHNAHYGKNMWLGGAVKIMNVHYSRVFSRNSRVEDGIKPYTTIILSRGGF